VAHEVPWADHATRGAVLERGNLAEGSAPKDLMLLESREWDARQIGRALHATIVPVASA
jgi:hypothetical protein